MKRKNILLSSAKPTEKKRVLSSPNNDYLEVLNDFGAINHADLFIKSVFDWDGNPQQGSIIGFGIYNNVLSGGVLARFVGTSLFVSVFSDTPSVAAITLSPLIIGTNELIIDGLDVYLNGILKVTFVDQGALGIDWGAYPLQIGRLSYNTGNPSFWLNGGVYHFQVQNEVFSLNEGNGINFKGSNNTTGTCHTSHSGGENYVNQDMIKPV